MADFRSALAGHLKPGRYGALGDTPPVTLSEQPSATILQLAGWPDNFARDATALLSGIGFSEPGEVGTAQYAGLHTVFRVAPERILLRSQDKTVLGQITQHIDSTAIALLDLSHARTVIVIAGMMAGDLLARLVSIDLHPDEFPSGSFVLTGIHGVPVMLHYLGDRSVAPRYELFIPYSWAASLWDLTCQAALPFGFEISNSLDGR